MTYKDKLIDLLKQKEDSVNITLYCDEDFKEILYRWSERRCKKVYKRIIQDVLHIAFPGSATTCPWCQRYFWTFYFPRLSCRLCGYGKRHGICHTIYSHYTKHCYEFRSAHNNLIRNIERTYRYKK